MQRYGRKEELDILGPQSWCSAILENEQSGETRPSSHCSLLSRKILFVERFFDLVGKARQIDI